MGLLSPFAIALQQRASKHQGVGTTAGEMFFFSTVGSIAGSLAAGFVLIPFFGIDAIVIGVGIILFLLGLLPLVLLGLDRSITIGAILVAGGVLALCALSTVPSRGIVYNRDGLYEKIVISDGLLNNRPTRFLQQDTSNSAAIYLDGDDLTYAYSKYYALHELFVPTVQRALVMGGGAYSIPKALLHDFPRANVDVSEIEPSLVPLAKQYFGLQDNPRLTHYIEDGRRMLHDTDHRYDLIFSDVYHSLYSIPSHMTTVEAMRLVRDRLNPGGVFMANLIGSTDRQDPSFLWSQIKTMQQVFPQVYLFTVESPAQTGTQNIIAVGDTSRKRVDINDPRWRRSAYEVVRTIAGHYLDTTRLSLDRYALLTDQYAPVDYLTARVLPTR